MLENVQCLEHIRLCTNGVANTNLQTADQQTAVGPNLPLLLQCKARTQYKGQRAVRGKVWEPLIQLLLIYTVWTPCFIILVWWMASVTSAAIIACPSLQFQGLDQVFHRIVGLWCVHSTYLLFLFIIFPPSFDLRHPVFTCLSAC